MPRLQRNERTPPPGIRLDERPYLPQPPHLEIPMGPGTGTPGDRLQGQPTVSTALNIPMKKLADSSDSIQLRTFLTRTAITKRMSNSIHLVQATTHSTLKTIKTLTTISHITLHHTVKSTSGRMKQTTNRCFSTQTDTAPILKTWTHLSKSRWNSTMTYNHLQAHNRRELSAGKL